MGEVDLSEFEALTEAGQGRKPCKIGLALDRLETDRERGQLEAALGRRDITPGGIDKWLRLRDLPSNTTAIINHRKGTCSCAKAAA